MNEKLPEFLLGYLRAKTNPEQHALRKTLPWACQTLAGFRDVDDRAVRRAIEKLRRTHPDGAFIISSSDESGYFWSEDPADLEAANAEDLSRMTSTREKMANRERALARVRARPLAQERMFGG